MKNEQELKKIVSWVCEDYEDKILNGIQESAEVFPYTLAVANFMSELKNKNIFVNLNSFEDTILDMIYREFKNYIGR